MAFSPAMWEKKSEVSFQEGGGSMDRCLVCENKTRGARRRPGERAITGRGGRGAKSEKTHTRVRNTDDVCVDVLSFLLLCSVWLMRFGDTKTRFDENLGSTVDTHKRLECVVGEGERERSREREREIKSASDRARRVGCFVMENAPTTPPPSSPCSRADDPRPRGGAPLAPFDLRRSGCCDDDQIDVRGAAEGDEGAPPPLARDTPPV